MRCKKANIEDGFLILAWLFGLSIFFVIIYHVWGQIAPELGSVLQTNMPSNAGINVTGIVTDSQEGLGSLNNLFPLLLLGMVIATCISAFFVNSHPAFFFVSLILLVVLLTLAPILSNAYQNVIENSELSTDAGQFTTMNFMMEKLPWIILVVFIIIAIVFFGKPGGASAP